MSHAVTVEEQIVAVVRSEGDRVVEVIVEGVRVIERLGAGADMVIGEVPLGAIDGINATFTSLNTFVPSSLAVYLNGLRQRIVGDYQVAGNAITFLVSPLPNEHLLIDYQRG